MQLKSIAVTISRIILALILLNVVLFLEIYVFKVEEDFWSLLQIPFLILYFAVISFTSKSKNIYIVLIGGLTYFLYSLMGNLYADDGDLLLTVPAFIIGCLFGFIGYLTGTIFSKIFKNS